MNGVQNLRSVYEMRGGEESINGRWWMVDVDRYGRDG